MRVLFVSALQIHPPMSGGTLRSYGLVSALRAHGFDVRVCSLTGRRADYEARRPSGTETWPDGTLEHVDRGPASALSWLLGFAAGLPPVWITAQLAVVVPRALREGLRWCDAVVADFPFVAPVFSARAARGKRRVLSAHNVEHRLGPGHGGRGGRPVRSLVRRIELRAARAADVVVSCCDGDKAFFDLHAAPRDSVVVPNGVDLRRFEAARGERERVRRWLGVDDDTLVLLFTGSKWGPNHEALVFLESFARAHRRLLADQRVHVVVVGSVSPEPVRAPCFTATGRVAEVEPFFAAADAAINPIEAGAGTNVKVAEFLAARLPLLTTAFGARGFDLRHDRTAFFFERADLAAVIEAVREVFDDDPASLRRMAEAAYADNEAAVDMRACVAPLAAALLRERVPSQGPVVLEAAVAAPSRR
jgi:glycosyltransferase involved in cell wall biosynthesis